MHSIWSYILVMAIVTYSIRVLPLTLIRSEIKNRTIRSFLYYVPYVTLAVMTFPAIINETATPLSGAAALLLRSGRKHSDASPRFRYSPSSTPRTAALSGRGQPAGRFPATSAAT